MPGNCLTAELKGQNALSTETTGHWEGASYTISSIDELLKKDLLAVVAVSRARIMAAQNTILNDGNISVRAADTVEQEVVTIGARLVASISESLIDLSCVIACGIWKELVCSIPHDLEGEFEGHWKNVPFLRREDPQYL